MWLERSAHLFCSSGHAGPRCSVLQLSARVRSQNLFIFIKKKQKYTEEARCTHMPWLKTARYWTLRQRRICILLWFHISHVTGYHTAKSHQNKIKIKTHKRADVTVVEQKCMINLDEQKKKAYCFCNGSKAVTSQ